MEIYKKKDLKFRSNVAANYKRANAKLLPRPTFVN